MSVDEPVSSVPSSNGGIPRSKSFTGELGHKRSPSSNSAEGCGVHESEVGARTTWGPALGSSLQSPRLFRRHLSFGSQPKIPKTPRPGRTAVMFEKVFEGLRECLLVTKDDVKNLTKTTDDLTSQAQQQLKAAERYMKRLEYQISKLEELQDKYNIQQKLREGMRNMAHAYVSSSGRERDAALNSVKAGFRESSEIMCAIELQLEKMMGTLHFQMKGIQGFARLCTGDVFEITIKHSSQKWKSRGRVLKNGQQNWDSPHATFKALLGEILFIKATEIKGLGKTVLLGNKFCETRELFSAHPQIMTVNLNPSGSLKLNVVITWNPLDGSIDEVMRSQLNTTLFNQPGRRNILTPNATPITPRVPPLVDLSQRPRPFVFQNYMQKYPSQDCLSRPFHHSLSQFPDSNRRSEIEISSKDKLFEKLKTVPKINQPQIGRASSLECCSMGRDVAEEEDDNSDSVSVLEAVRNLASCLEDIQGQYPELHSLEQQVSFLAQMFQRNRRGSHSSDISTSIESVLECFDFLNTETDDEEDEEESEWISNRFSNPEIPTEPEIMGKTSDSGVGSLTHHVNLEQTNDSNPCAMNKSLSSNSDQLDLVLVIHLSYCQHLAESLGSFGPLKCKEIYALEKLKKQIPILENLIDLLKTSKEDRKQISGADELKENSEMQLIWGHFTDHTFSFCISANQMLKTVQELCQPQLHDKSAAFVASVSKLFITRILDASRFDADAVVTIYQFKIYFQHVDNFDFEKHIAVLAEEVRVNEVLQSYDVPAILEALSQMAISLPTNRCLQTSSQLLLVPHQNIQQAVHSFLEKCNSSEELRKKVLNAFVEALESESSLIRQCACLALIRLKASECIDQLAYLYQSDQCTNVRNAAKEALISFGPSGRKMFEQCQLSSHGFHGLGIK